MRNAETNRQLVEEFLLISGSPVGLTAGEIAEGAGLSRSTVYRVLNNHPAIERVLMGGIETNRFKLNIENLHEVRANRARGHLKLAFKNVPASYKSQVNKLSTEAFLEELVSTAPTQALHTYSTVVPKIVEWQKGGPSLKEDEVIELREAIKVMMNWALFSLVKFYPMSHKAAFKNHEDFWRLFPKGE